MHRTEAVHPGSGLILHPYQNKSRHFHKQQSVGQDHLKTSIIRFNHMGLIPVYETAWMVNALELALQKAGLRTFDGTANAVFLQKYYALLS